MFGYAGESATVEIPLSPFKKGGQEEFRTYVKQQILLKFAAAIQVL